MNAPAPLWTTVSSHASMKEGPTGAPAMLAQACLPPMATLVTVRKLSNIARWCIIYYIGCHCCVPNKPHILQTLAIMVCLHVSEDHNLTEVNQVINCIRLDWRYTWLAYQKCYVFPSHKLPYLIDAINECSSSPFRPSCRSIMGYGWHW